MIILKRSTVGVVAILTVAIATLIVNLLVHDVCESTTLVNHRNSPVVVLHAMSERWTTTRCNFHILSKTDREIDVTQLQEVSVWSVLILTLAASHTLGMIESSIHLFSNYNISDLVFLALRKQNKLILNKNVHHY